MIHAQQLASAALDIGDKMLSNGAEIYRVEDTIVRICRAYKAVHIDVFVITSHIILTVQLEEEAPFTQMRLISRGNTPDLDYLNGLNEFSRKICRSTPSMSVFYAELKQIPKKTYPLPIKCMTNALISASFSFYSGGTPLDGVVSALIGILLAIASHFLANIKFNRVFTTFCSAAFCGILASIAVTSGLGDTIDKIVIGDIMILVPGLALTNSIRDIINGDIVSGLVRLAESLFITISLAAGFALALLLFGL